MSSPDRTIPRRALLLGALGLGAGALSACGFRPVYGDRPGGPGAAANLAAIEIVPFAGRVGQVVQNELAFRFYRGGDPAPAAYRLTALVTVSSRGLIIEASGRSTAVTVDVFADYRLTRIADEAVVVAARATASASYDRTGQSFANLRAQRDAEDRAAEVLADDLWTRIAASLAAR